MARGGEKARAGREEARAGRDLLLIVDVTVEDIVHAHREEHDLAVELALAHTQLKWRQVVAQLLQEWRRLCDERRVV